jgi:hypothetical protein
MNFREKQQPQDHEIIGSFYLRHPIPELFEAARYLDEAVTAHINGQPDLVAEIIRRADMPAIREWTESLWGKNSPYVRYRPVSGGPPHLSSEQRVSMRMPSKTEKDRLIARDGYHCRFCGIPVIRKEVRERFKALYPQLMIWGSKNTDQHAAFQALWLQYDHILPHARGGNNELDNMVITCAPCNYGRMQYTLDEVGLADPRTRKPVTSSWDGLERLLTVSKTVRKQDMKVTPKTECKSDDGNINQTSDTSAWHRKYWDIVDQFYWWPRYIGLRSISQKHWIKKDDLICVPVEMVNKTGPLYSRERNVRDLKDYLLGCEEILNHIFDLTFSIAPDSVINKILFSPLGFNDSGSIKSMGRECAKRYGWGELDNITQHDGFFVSDKSAVGVELKLLSSSWPEQVLKYAALMSWEEIHKGARQQLGLLFIVPESAIESHWKKCGLTSTSIDRTFLEQKWKRNLPKAISDLLTTNYDNVASVLDRMKLGIISWEDLRDSMVTLQSTLDPTHRGDQTLIKLISGFIAQLAVHRDTGILSRNAE